MGTATNPISNRFLKSMMFPADATNCPAQADTEIKMIASGSINARTVKHDFSGTLPNSNARDWHCKWKISAEALADVLIDGTTID